MISVRKRVFIGRSIQDRLHPIRARDSRPRADSYYWPVRGLNGLLIITLAITGIALAFGAAATAIGWQRAQFLLQRGGHAYGQNAYGEPAHAAFVDRLGRLEGVIQNQDNREHDILDSADYFQFQGGMANAAGAARASDMPAIYHGDHSNPAAPCIRTLNEEINRVMRARVTNPKWIEAMQGHGYKGAFEMAATVDYLFAYDATTDTVADYQYAAVADAFVHDADNRAFMEQHNPHALADMTERLLEAVQRGLWAEPGDHRERLENTLLDLEAIREGASG